MPKTNVNLETDIAIIGAGPIGIFTAFQAGMLGLKSTIIETLEYIGGQCTALYPEKPIFDIPAYQSITAAKLVENLYEQAKVFSPQILLQNTVNHITKNDYGWQITTSQDKLINARAIIIAAGAGSLNPHKLPILNIESFEDKNIFYKVDNKALFKNKVIAIAGGGDSAVDWAIELAGIAKKIYVIHRRNKFKALPENVSKLLKIAEEGKIELLIPYQIHNIHGNNGYLKSIEVVDLDNNKKEISAEILLPFFGLAMELGHIPSWGINLHKKHIVVDPSNMQTNLEKVYAIGDIATYKGKLKLILTGFAEAALACHSAYSVIYPDKPLHFEHSTTKGVPRL